MPYVKLDAGILDSTLWVEDAVTCKVFITMLAMCRPNGMCESTAPGIARRANVSLEETRKAIETLEAPDPDSRSVEDDGRRVKRVDGGYLVVNYQKYRDKDHTNADRQRRFRARQKGDIEAEIEARDGRICGICASPIGAEESAHVDHIVPLSKGGLDQFSNLQLAHAKCNQSKNNFGNVPNRHPSLPDINVTAVTRYVTPPFASASVSIDQKIVTPDGVDPQAWADMCAYRSLPENRRAWGWSGLAQTKMANALAKYPPAVQREMVDKAIRNGWRGVWEESRRTGGRSDADPFAGMVNK